MKYKMSAFGIGLSFTMMLKSYLKTHNEDNLDIKRIAKDVKKEYKAIIKRTPDLNGNIMEGNLIGASYFFAMARVIPGMTPDRMDKLIVDVMHSKMMAMATKKEREKGLLFSEKSHNKMIKGAEASHHSKLEYDWEFDYTPGKDEYFQTVRKCGVCKLAKQENLMEYLPCMCKMDYPKYEMKGAKLLRTKTLANGDDCCDFHLTRIK